MGSNWHRKVGKKKEKLARKRKKQTPRVNEDGSLEENEMHSSSGQENVGGDGCPSTHDHEKNDRREICEQCEAEYYSSEYKMCSIAKGCNRCWDCC